MEKDSTEVGSGPGGAVHGPGGGRSSQRGRWEDARKNSASAQNTPPPLHPLASIANQSSVALLAAAAHPTGDLLRALDFPFLYVYRFHGSCCASGLLGFLVTLSAVKLKSLVAPGQCAAWLLLAQVATAGSSVLLFEGVLTRAAVGCLLLGGLGEALLVFAERRGTPR